MPTPAPAPVSALEPTDTFEFDSGDGTALHGEYYAAPDARAAALIVHGYAEHGGRYREVASVLTAAGVSTLAFDLRGHGRSAGQRGFVRSFGDYMDDVDAAIEELTRLCGAIPVLLVAHSNGGLIALRMLADPNRVPPRTVGAVISSPFLGLKLKVGAVKTAVARLASRFAPTFALPNSFELAELTSDPVKQEERKLDTLCHDVASARYFTEAEATQTWVLDNAHRIEVPSLWLVAGGDQIADPMAARAVADRVVAPITYERLDGFQHEVFNEVGRDALFDRVRAFIRQLNPAKS